MNVTDKTGKIVGAEVVDEDDVLMVITTTGKSIRTPLKPIRVTGRVAQGVKIINLAPGDQVRSIARLVRSIDEGENPESAEGEEATEVVAED